jgi:hypothetical protein
MRIHLVIAVVGLAMSNALPTLAETGQSITFDAPGASATSGLGTFPLDINDLGQAMGYVVGDQHVFHGFVRSADGRFETIDAPGAGTLAGSFQGTIPDSINIQGMIVGQYKDANNIYHGFLREPDGHFVIIDVPGASTTLDGGTFAVNINVEGEIAGYFFAMSSSPLPILHCFLRSPSGAFTIFDGAPNAVSSSVATSSGLNALGMVIGTYGTGDFNSHGFVRQPWGAVTSFDFTPTSINLEGAITGNDASFTHGFIRSVSGAITTFEVPGGAVLTEPSGISLFGVITGTWLDSNNVNHGFIRYPNGAFCKFDAPGSGTLAQSGQGTAPQAINSWGEIVGQVQDSNYIYHGFIRLP